jgi:hypothetical protein
MRHAGLGLLVGVVLVTVIVSYAEAWGQRPNLPADEQRSSDSKSLIALSTSLEGRQQVTLVDPHSRVLAVYHIDQASGAIALRSVRQVHWDFQLDDFNTTNPTPREIRAMAERR